jgi:hypothetical protein
VSVETDFPEPMKLHIAAFSLATIWSIMRSW